MAVWVAPGNGFEEPNFTLRRIRMCRDAIARGEITLKELANELDAEVTHFKRLLNRILTDAGEKPIGLGPQIWNGRSNGKNVCRDITVDNQNARRCYIGERVDGCVRKSTSCYGLAVRSLASSVRRRSQLRFFTGGLTPRLCRRDDSDAAGFHYLFPARRTARVMSADAFPRRPPQAASGAFHL